MMQQIIITITASLLGAVFSGAFTAWLASYWIAKQNSLHITHVKETLIKAETKLEDHDRRINKAEKGIAVLQHQRQA